MVRHVGNPPDRHVDPHLPQPRLGVLERTQRRGKLGHFAGQRGRRAVAHAQQRQAEVASFALVGPGLAAAPVAGHQFHLQPSQKLHRHRPIAEVLHLLGRGFGQRPLLLVQRRAGQGPLHFQRGGQRLEPVGQGLSLPFPLGQFRGAGRRASCRQPALELRFCLLQLPLDFCYPLDRLRVVVRDIGHGGTPFRQNCEKGPPLSTTRRYFSRPISSYKTGMLSVIFTTTRC